MCKILVAIVVLACNTQELIHVIYGLLLKFLVILSGLGFLFTTENLRCINHDTSDINTGNYVNMYMYFSL